MTTPISLATGTVASVLLALCVSVPAAQREVVVSVQDHLFEPAIVVIQAGQSVRWTNQGSTPHNVAADDGSFRCANGCDDQGGNGGLAGNPWSFSRTFDEPGDIGYHCQLHGAPGGVGMSGMVVVMPSGDPDPGPDPDPDPEPEFAINFGLTGSWWNPATSGQGFLFDVVIGQQPPQLVIYWFTYDTEAGGPEAQRWFLAQGTFEGETDTVQLDVQMVTGGAFDQPDPVDQVSVGSAEIQFDNCLEATLSYSIDFNGDPEQHQSGTIPVERLSPDVLCQELANEDPG